MMRMHAQAQVCVGEWTILRKCANTDSKAAFGLRVMNFFLFPFVLSLASSVLGSARMQTGLKTM